MALPRLLSFAVVLLARVASGDESGRYDIKIQSVRLLLTVHWPCARRPYSCVMAVCTETWSKFRAQVNSTLGKSWRVQGANLTVVRVRRDMCAGRERRP